MEQKLYQVEQQDLRLHDPFDELLEFCRDYTKFYLDDMPLERHMHVPYVVLLIQALDKWKSEHQGKKPGNFNEKNQFKVMLKSMAKELSKELNFTEAIKHAF